MESPHPPEDGEATPLEMTADDTEGLGFHPVPPLHLVGKPPPLQAFLQAVGRLQHCSYTYVNDPRKILMCTRESGDVPSVVAIRDHRFRTAQSHRSSMTLPRHNRRRAHHTGAALWIGSGQGCELVDCFGDDPVFSRVCAVHNVCISTPHMWVTPECGAVTPLQR